MQKHIGAWQKCGYFWELVIQFGREFGSGLGESVESVANYTLQLDAFIELNYIPQFYWESKIWWASPSMV